MIPEIMLPLIGERREYRNTGLRDSRGRRRNLKERESKCIHDRHDDRGAARLYRGRMKSARSLNSFPSAPTISRRWPMGSRATTRANSSATTSSAASTRRTRSATRSRRRRRPDANRDRARPQGQPEAQARHLRRAWRRSRERRNSAIASGSTTFRVRHFGFRSLAWPPRRPQSRNVAPSAPSRMFSEGGLRAAGGRR